MGKKLVLVNIIMIVSYISLSFGSTDEKCTYEGDKFVDCTSSQKLDYILTSEKPNYGLLKDSDWDSLEQDDWDNILKNGNINHPTIPANALAQAARDGDISPSDVNQDQRDRIAGQLSGSDDSALFGQLLKNGLSDYGMNHAWERDVMLPV